jgi:hypothetical protein
LKIRTLQSEAWGTRRELGWWIASGALKLRFRAQK